MALSEEQRIEEAVMTLSHAVNVSYGDKVAEAIRHEHPTLIGQMAKAVAVGVMRRTLRETWKPYGVFPKGTVYCNLQPHGSIPGTDYPLAKVFHPEHDGRLDCSTVIAAELMARQSLI